MKKYPNMSTSSTPLQEILGPLQVFWELLESGVGDHYTLPLVTHILVPFHTQKNRKSQQVTAATPPGPSSCVCTLADAAPTVPLSDLPRRILSRCSQACYWPPSSADRPATGSPHGATACRHGPPPAIPIRHRQ
jgi:hypothetical protein